MISELAARSRSWRRRHGHDGAALAEIPAHRPARPQADAATLINRDLPERRIELAVVPMMSPLLRDDLVATILYRDSWHVVAGIRSPWTRRKKVELAELADAFSGARRR